MTTKQDSHGMGNVLNSLEGEGEWILRNADGSVAASGSAKNVVTHRGRRVMAMTSQLPFTMYIMDDEHPQNLKREISSFKVDQLTPPAHHDVSGSVLGLVRTFTTSFSPPSATRTIRKIGMGYTDSNPQPGVAMIISSYLEIPIPIVQTTSQSFEVTYRYSISINSIKSLHRWQTFLPADELAIANELITGTISAHGVHLGHWCFGKHFFVDQGGNYLGVPAGDGVGSWLNFQDNGTEFRAGDTLRRGNDASILTTSASNDSKTGPIGVMLANRSNGGTYPSFGGNLSSDLHSYGFYPLATNEGDISPVFKHPSGELYLYNVVGSLANSLGNMSVTGPFRPDDKAQPWHYWHSIKIEGAGDTDGGTEGTYTYSSGKMHTFPNQPSYYGNAQDGSAIPGVLLNGLYTVGNTTDGRSNGVPNTCFDGIDTYWASPTSTGTSSRLWRWRGGTNESIISNANMDLTRYYGFDAPVSANGSYYLASDNAGLIMAAHRHSTLASQIVYRIDNTKPGRWYQRPSGSVNAGNTFTVSAADEIHIMHPFVSGDAGIPGVGKKIRIVNAALNADTVRTITGFTDANTVTLDGYAFTAESNLTWHFVVVDKLSTGGIPGIVKGLDYDVANNRLWAFTDTGLAMSSDKGATWSALIDETNGSGALTTAAAKVLFTQDGLDSPRTHFLGPNGSLYWIDTNNAINKYSGAFPGTHTRITNAALPGFANGFTKGTIVSICPDIGCDVPTGEGAMWIGQDRVSNQGFWRLPLNSFIAGLAVPYDNISIGGQPSGEDYLNRSTQQMIPLPDGTTLLGGAAFGPRYMSFNPATGLFTGQGTIFASASTFPGLPVVKSDGTLLFWGTANDVSGLFMGMPVNYMWDDSGAQTWRPFAGSPAHFAARFPHANNNVNGIHGGGRKNLHAGNALLANNIGVKFTQLGGATPATDEFVINERFTFIAAWGVFRTNVDDVSFRYDYAMAPTELKIETENIKTATGRGNLHVYYQARTGAPAEPAAGLVLGTDIPSLDANGQNWGWFPRKTSVLSGGGNSPSTGASIFSAQCMGLDLGAAPPVISKLQIYNNGPADLRDMAYHRIDTGRSVVRVFQSDDNSTWTEVPEVRSLVNGVAEPDPGYKYACIEQGPGGNGSSSVFGQELDANILMTFHLEAAGLTALQRTHRYWKVYRGSFDVNANVGGITFGSISAIDSSGVYIGMGVNHHVDEALDSDFAAWILAELAFIQTHKTGGSDGINTVPDGYADGFTDTVTINTGTFNAGVINTTTDFLAWVEPGAPGYGFIRTRAYGEAAGFPGATNYQAMAKIVALLPAGPGPYTQIQVAKRNVPDNLSNANWEVRRFATITAGPDVTAGTVAYDPVTGYMQFDLSDEGRLFRITRKSIVRLP